MCKLRWRLALLLLRKEVQDMAIVYATLIIKGRKTIDQVPALLRKQVEEILADLEVEVRVFLYLICDYFLLDLVEIVKVLYQEYDC